MRAYRNAARTIGDLPESLSQILADAGRSVEDIAGIGHDLAEKIKTIATTGSLPQLEELRQQVPRGVVDMLRISGLGPKKAAALFKELSITSLDMLKTAAESGEVAKLKGFGEKTAKIILEGLAHVEQAGVHVLCRGAATGRGHFVRLAQAALSDAGGSGWQLPPPP